MSREMVWRPCRRALLAAAVLTLHTFLLLEAAADREFEPAVRLGEEVNTSTYSPQHLKIYTHGGHHCAPRTCPLFCTLPPRCISLLCWDRIQDL